MRSSFSRLVAVNCATRRMRAIAIVSATALGLNACHSTEAAPSEVPVGRGVDSSLSPVARDSAALFQTDSLAYVLRAGEQGYQGVIGVTLTNRTSGTAYIVNCGGSTALSLEKRYGSTWQRVWSPVIPACLSPAIVIRTGESYRTQINIFGGYSGTKTAPQFEVTNISGEYRAVWVSILSSYDVNRSSFGDQLPLDARISNRFTLVAPVR